MAQNIPRRSQNPTRIMQNLDNLFLGWNKPNESKKSLNITSGYIRQAYKMSSTIKFTNFTKFLKLEISKRTSIVFRVEFSKVGRALEPT